MLTGTCHCGAVRVQVPEAPTSLTSCNCSLCRRIGGLWAYYPASTVGVHGHPEQTQEYVQGDRTLRTIRCKTCGCTTHWEPIELKSESRFGVNMRNFEPALLQGAELKLLDGANTWTSVPANELVRPKRAVNRPWHDAQPMPPNATLQERVAWHRAHALACGCRPVPESILAIIARESAA